MAQAIRHIHAVGIWKRRWEEEGMGRMKPDVQTEARHKTYPCKMRKGRDRGEDKRRGSVFYAGGRGERTKKIVVFDPTPFISTH
jgi:hypothetical protein